MASRFINQIGEDEHLADTTSRLPLFNCFLQCSDFFVKAVFKAVVCDTYKEGILDEQRQSLETGRSQAFTQLNGELHCRNQRNTR
jgi:hypothetical protein